MQDHDLLEELQANPDRGMEQMVGQYTGLVYSIINQKLSTVGTKEDVKECVSDVFMEFYSQRERIDLDRGSIKAYLAIIARNKGIDLFRKLSRTAAHTICLEEDDIEQGQSMAGPEQEVLVKEQKKLLFRAINALGEPDREIFVRKYYIGQKTKEIAEVLDIRENTVDKKISRGLKKLRALLGGVSYEGEDSVLVE